MMFLRKDNTVKWKWIAYGAGITLVLCLAGICWFDKPLYLLMRNMDWSIWGIFNQIFATKVWLFVSFMGALLIGGLRLINSNFSLKKFFKKFKWGKFWKWVHTSIKTNYFALMFCSVFSAAVVTGILKVILGRARPIFFEALNQTGFYPFTPDWAFNSMPSGHSSASFAGLVMIGLLYPRVKWLTWISAIVIGASRVCFGAHFPTDVILGAFIGMVVADLVKSFFFKKTKKK